MTTELHTRADGHGVFDEAPGSKPVSGPSLDLLELSRTIDVASAGKDRTPATTDVGAAVEVAADDDWQSLLDDSIPVQSFSRKPEIATLLGTSTPNDDPLAEEPKATDKQAKTRIALAGSMIACLAVLAAVLVPTDQNDDEGSTTAADTEAAAAEQQEATPSTRQPSEETERAAPAAGVGVAALSYDFDELAGDIPLDLLSDADAAVDDDDDPDADDDTDATGDDATTSADESGTGEADGTTLTPAASTDDTDSSTTTGSTSTTTGPSTTEAPSTTAAPTTTAPPTTACSGASWNLVLQDDFNGSSVDTGVWAPYNSGGNAGYGLRRPSALSVSGGMLNITAQMIDGTLVSGGMQHRHHQMYGRYEFRVRTDQDTSEATSGVVLTWPQSNVHPRDGENNIYETLATPGNRSEFYTFIHKPFGSTSDQDYTVHSTSAASWHTMAMEWTPSWIKLYRDGSLIKTITETGADLIPDTSHFLAIQLDAWKHSVGANTTMQVDWVKVWSYGGGC